MASVSFVVYSDRSDLVLQHPRIEVIPIERSDLIRWTGRYRYIHRAKLEILRRCAGDVGLPFIFVDTDTQWHVFPEDAVDSLYAAAAPQQRRPFYMWKYYEKIHGGSIPEYSRLIEGSADLLADFGLGRFSAQEMWNSGIIGVPAVADGVFEDMIALADRLCGRLERWRHVRCIEQIAVSLVAQQRFALRPLQDHVDHYYRFKNVANLIVHDILDDLNETASVDEQARVCAANLLTEDRVARSRYVARWTGRATARFRRSWKNKSNHARQLWMRLRQAARAS